MWFHIQEFLIDFQSNGEAQACSHGGISGQCAQIFCAHQILLFPERFILNI